MAYGMLSTVLERDGRADRGLGVGNEHGAAIAGDLEALVDPVGLDAGFGGRVGSEEYQAIHVHQVEAFGADLGGVLVTGGLR